MEKPRMPLLTISESLAEKIIADYKNGMTKKEVASKNGISTYYVTNCLNDHDIENNKRISTKEEPAWINTAVEMYYNGNTLAEISERVGIHTRVLSNHFKKSGATEEKKRRTLESFQPVIDDFVKGMKQLELEEKYPQFSKNNIKHIINKFCPKRKEEISADEEEIIIAMLPKAEVKAKVRVTKEIVNKKIHVYQDIFDLIAGV